MKWLKDINGKYVNANKIIEIGVVHDVETGDYYMKPHEICGEIKVYHKYCAVRACTEADKYYLYAERYEPTDAKAEEIAADYCQEYLDALIKNLSC